MTSLAVTPISSVLCHAFTSLRIGPKLRRIRSTYSRRAEQHRVFCEHRREHAWDNATTMDGDQSSRTSSFASQSHAQASLREFFSGGNTRIPVPTTPSVQRHAITNRFLRFALHRTLRSV